MPFKRPTAFAEIDAHSACNPDRVDAGMVVKAFVFGRDDGVFQVRGYSIRRDHPAELVTAPSEDLAVSIKQRDRPAGATIDQFFNRGKSGQVIPDSRRYEQSDNHRQAPADAPDHQPNEPKSA